MWVSSMGRPPGHLWVYLVVILTWTRAHNGDKGNDLNNHLSKKTAHEQELVAEYCDTERFQPSCAENEVIFMKSAKYGRMRLGKCVEIDLGYLGCYTDVLDLADRRCSGRRSCEIRVPDADFEETRPCLKELKTYLEASYSCVPVTTGTPHECESAEFINITSSSGWIASIVTTETGCGSITHPWIINVNAGQRINITLYDFSRQKPYKAQGVDFTEIDTQVCKEYALIQETTKEWSSVVCGGGKRIQHVYSSKTNTVEMQITNTELQYFMLYYEAIGCPDVTPPAFGWFEREEMGAVIGCQYSRQKWHITCSGTMWVGYVGNCSSPQQMPIEDVQTYDINLPLGASIAIIIGAAIGVGFVVVVIGLLRFKGLFFFGRSYRPYETPPPRETIMLREKSPQSPELQQDSGHCSLDTQEMIDAACNSGTMTPQRAIRHQRIIKINGNEYAHIWESPLPGSPGCEAAASCRLCPRDPRDPMGRNTVYMYRCKPEDGHVCNTLTLKHIKSEGATLDRKTLVGPILPGTVVNACTADADGNIPCTSPQGGASCNIERTSCIGPQNTPPGGTGPAGINERRQNLQNESYEAPRYSSLERNGRYGNSSSSV